LIGIKSILQGRCPVWLEAMVVVVEGGVSGLLVVSTISVVSVGVVVLVMVVVVSVSIWTSISVAIGIAIVGASGIVDWGGGGGVVATFSNAATSTSERSNSNNSSMSDVSLLPMYKLINWIDGVNNH
jgi:hypothetical protein